MANELDELHDYSNPNGNDVNVIEKKIPVKAPKSCIVIEVCAWIFGIIIGGIIFEVMKQKAKAYFQGLEQKIQHNASQIDNYLEQRVVILSNLTELVKASMTQDKDVFIDIAKARSGMSPDSDVARNETNSILDSSARSINLAFERYPELQSQQNIKDAMRQNSTLQREITAAREVYNDSVLQWNREIFSWPVKVMVAGKAGYTTRIPFSTSVEVKAQARSNFFETLNK